MDWKGLFAVSEQPLELIIRGSMIYLFLLILFRLFLKREPGTLSIPDLLVIVLVADASQNAMASGYTSVTEGLILIGTILFWSFLLDFLSFRFRTFERIIHPPPLLLVQDGKLLYRNMRKEFVSAEELMSQLREQGIDDLQEVKKAYMEGDGRISVIRNETAR